MIKFNQSAITASHNAAPKRKKVRNNRLVRIDGEVLTMAEVLEKTELKRERFNLLYRTGVNTWLGLGIVAP